MDLQNSHQNRPTKIKFEYEEDNDDDIIEEAATASSNLEEDSSMCEPDGPIIGADQTSADYYFDSYSHFGKIIDVKLLFIPYHVHYLYIFKFTFLRVKS